MASDTTDPEPTISGPILSPGTRVVFTQRSQQYGTQEATYEVLPFMSSESTTLAFGETVYPVKIVNVRFPDMDLER